MANKRITDPAVEPVTLAQLKSYGKLPEETDNDDNLTLMIAAAREHFELTTGVALITQTWRTTLDRLPGVDNAEEEWWDGVREGALVELTTPKDTIELGTYPVQSITSFKANQPDGSQSTFTAYTLDSVSRPARVVLNYGAVWPVSVVNVNRYQIDYVAGYGADGTSVPADIKLCIMMLALHFNENREVMTYDTAAVKVPLHCERVMQRHKVMRLL